MIKLFDSIATLEFIDSKAITEKKVAVGMHAKDGEYVKFNEECDCSGPVSIYNYVLIIIIILCKIIRISNQFRLFYEYFTEV